MSEEKVRRSSSTEIEGSSTDQGQTPPQSESRVFYRCTCPDCGEDTLELCGLDVFFRSDFLGVTRRGEFGCGFMKLDGDYHWVIQCGSCGYEAFNTNELSDDDLINWAAANGRAKKMLEFKCPICGSDYLDEVFSANRSVRAVYETSDNEDAEFPAEVALSYEQAREYGEPVRYRCSNGHELAKEDGSPVETPAELVQWLKSRKVSY